SDLQGGCHCGAIKIAVPELPRDILQCNCSLCTKTGWIGGYWRLELVTIRSSKEALTPYVQGDKTITAWHCRTCGCVTHWTPITAPPDRMGVNMRMFDWNDWNHIPVIEVDGASF
ncbi:hypothetical protein MNBD_ALPHA04-667, partial [hydrothermal vent metagenome]